MTGKTLLLGVDGATFSILEPLMEAGVMPCLSELMAAGCRAQLASVVPPLTPPAWTSVMTGRSPGNHGIFDFMRFEFREDDRLLRIMDSSDVACETIWSIASRQGLKTTVLNFPLTFPAPAINGSVVPGWVPWRHLSLACHPEDLYTRLKALPGFNPRELAMDMQLEERALEGCTAAEDYESLIKLHVRREEQWLNVLRLLMSEEPADLTAILFDGVDKLQHFCWRFIDAKCFPAEPSAWELRVRELCLDYFRALDRILAEVIASSGPEAHTIIVSDHGFGPTDEVFYLNEWLCRNGYLTWANASEVEQKHPETLGLGTMARRFYEIDWENTTAYCPTPSSNGIFFTRSRAAGGGSDDPDYARLRDELKAALSEIRAPDGGAIITQVWTRDEVFAGSQSAHAPDLTVMLRDGGFVSILPSEEVIKPREEVSGTHRPMGVFAAAGPGVARGLKAEPLSLLDVASTVLYTLGLLIPEDLEGRVPEEIFDPDYLTANPVRSGPPTEQVAAGASASSADAEVDEEVLKQLQALGYLE